jgi:hypothetical protein
MGSTDPKGISIEASFQSLASLSNSLNAASSELTRYIGVLDEALKKLNIGLTVWVTFQDKSDEDKEHQFSLDQIGYAKVNGKWGIALRNKSGDEREKSFFVQGPWLFNDATRRLRLASVEKIPQVIEQLNKAAATAVKQAQAKAASVGELATVVEKIANDRVGVLGALSGGREQSSTNPFLPPSFTDLLSKLKEDGGK